MFREVRILNGEERPARNEIGEGGLSGRPCGLERERGRRVNPRRPSLTLHLRHCRPELGQRERGERVSEGEAERRQE